MADKKINLLVIALILVFILISGYFILNRFSGNHPHPKKPTPMDLGETDKTNLYKNTVEKAKNTVDAVNGINEQAKDLLPDGQD